MTLEELYQHLTRLTSDEQPSTEDQEKLNDLDAQIAQNPHDSDAWVRKGFIYYKGQMDGKAIEAFNTALQLNPTNVDPYIWIAELLLFHWADAGHAILVLKQAVAIAPRRAELYYLWGCAYSKQHKLDQAIEYTQRAVDLQPTWPRPRMCLIDYLLEAGKREQACIELRALEQHINDDLVEPPDAMEQYYENLITGRCLTDYGKEWAETLRKSCSS